MWTHRSPPHPQGWGEIPSLYFILLTFITVRKSNKVIYKSNTLPSFFTSPCPALLLLIPLHRPPSSLPLPCPLSFHPPALPSFFQSLYPAILLLIPIPCPHFSMFSLQIAQSFMFKIFFSGVNTFVKYFLTGVKDTAKNFSPVSTTPLKTFEPVALTPQKIFLRCL